MSTVGIVNMKMRNPLNVITRIDQDHLFQKDKLDVSHCTTTADYFSWPPNTVPLQPSTAAIEYELCNMFSVYSAILNTYLIFYFVSRYFRDKAAKVVGGRVCVWQCSSIFLFACASAAFPKILRWCQIFQNTEIW